MGYREQEFYLSLSRKELQGLCKQHGLPVNRSKIHLAKSLESFFKRKNAISSPSEEASFGALPLTESKPEEPIKLPEGTYRDVGGKCERTDASEVDNSGRITSIKEKGFQIKRYSQAANQEISNHIDIQTSDKPLETATNVVCANPANGKTTEGFGCSTTDADTAGIQPLLATDVQETITLPQLCVKCHDNGSNNTSKDFSQLKNSHDKFPSSAATTTGIHNLPFIPRCKNFGEHSSNILLSSSEISTPVRPFQFFVRSEEGLNLYVDLNSTPAEWIKSLKDEVFMSQKPNCSKSQTLCHEIRELGTVNEKSKTSSTKNIETDLQTNRAERNNRCTKSSFCSIVNERCLSIAHPTGVNDRTSRSAAFESSSNPVEVSEYPDEGNNMVLSSCTSYSDLKNCMESDILSCRRDREMYPHNSAAISFIMSKTHAPLLDDSLNKFTGNSIAKSSTNRTKESEYRTLITGNVHLQNTEAGSFYKTSDSVSVKSCIALYNEIQENGSCHLSFTSGSKDTKLLEVGGQQNDASTALQFGGQQILDSQVQDVQIGVTESANHLLEHEACVSVENSVPGAPTLTFTEELGTSILLKEKENSECSQSNNSVIKTCKRSRSLELPEKFQSKRQHCNGKSQNETTMNLRSTKTLAKESTCDPVILPRRSIRLMSK